MNLHLTDIGSFVMSTLLGATPLILAAMGGVLSEKAGVVNIALEGFILAGAFIAVSAAHLFGGHGWVISSLMGILATVFLGLIMGMMHAFLTQRTRMDHVVSGLGINLLAMGATRYLYLHLYPNGVEVAGLDRRYFLVAALILPFLVQFLLVKTRFGLKLRACGEDPDSAVLAGVSVIPVRYVAVILSGILAALAGAYLTLGDAHNFSTDISAGKGYIALAAVIFGKWNPFGATGAALFFGFFYALQTRLQISSIVIHFWGIDLTNPFLMDTLPYLMTIIVLASFVGHTKPPAALGRQEVL